jgi:hypothetical protein
MVRSICSVTNIPAKYGIFSPQQSGVLKKMAAKLSLHVI